MEHNNWGIWVCLCAHVFAKDRNQRLEINFGFLQENFVVCSHYDSLDIEESGRQTTEIPFGTDIGPRPEHDEHVVFLGELEEKGKILVLCLIVKDSLGYFVVVPHNVDAERVEA